jgi:hypothetical protein
MRFAVVHEPLIPMMRLLVLVLVLLQLLVMVR